jgi:hypothetical protein
MRLNEREFSQLPPHLKALFRKLPNPGREEVLALFPSARSAGNYPSDSWGTGEGTTYASKKPQGQLYADSGSAARFFAEFPFTDDDRRAFYTTKADDADRAGSRHPTVKPVDLMQWLARLITPPGGTILDPFAGTGTTGVAAYREGFRAVLIEREAEYQADIARRMDMETMGPAGRRHAIAKAQPERSRRADHADLFGD